MMTLLKSAMNGWIDYTQHGKYAALLIPAMIYLGYRMWKRKPAETGRGQSVLYLYAVLITTACICPVTAAILMKYQTAFYSYVWIWAAVPQTVLIAWACTEFLYSLWREKSVRNAVATLILAGIVILSGNPVSEWTCTQLTQEEAPREMLEILSVYHLGESGETQMRLWAPKEIMAAARAYSADIHPVYGRSIWDAALGSYSYDTYEPWQEDLYLWMNHLEETGEPEYLRTDESTGERTIDFRTCLDSATAAGVDYILLPENMPEDTVEKLQETLGTDTELKAMAGYYLIEIRSEIG